MARQAVPKRDTSVVYHPAEIETRFQGAGSQGIVPGAHPEMEKKEPGVKAPDWFKNIQKHVGGMFKPQAGRPPAVHPGPPPTLTPEEADKIYNKYVK